MNSKLLRPKIFFSVIFIINLTTIAVLILEYVTEKLKLSKKSSVPFDTPFKCLLFTHIAALTSQMFAVFGLGMGNRKKFPHLLSIYLAFTGLFHFVLAPLVLAYCLISWHNADADITVYYDFLATTFVLLGFQTVFAVWSFYVIMVSYKAYLQDALFSDITKPLVENYVSI